MNFEKKKWIAFLATLISAVFVGVIYSWSVYVNPLAAKYGWSISETSLAYALNIICTAMVPILTSRLRTSLPLKRYVLIGAFIYGGGLILCGLIQGSVLELYLYFGVLNGGGIGFVYLSQASYVVKLFPENRGLAAGSFTACYGLGALFWSPAARTIISRTGDVDLAFIYLGLLFTVVLALCSCFLFDPPPELETVPTSKAPAAGNKSSGLDWSSGQLLRSPLYYTILLVIIFGLVAGSMVLSMGAPILEATLNFSPEKAAVIVGFFAVASTSGRFLWGLISDRLGRLRVLMILGSLSSLVMLILVLSPGKYLFLICLFVTAMCYGAYASIMVPVALETFGPSHFVMNYNLIFAAFGLASLIGPQIIARVGAFSGAYQGAFYYGLAFAASSVLLAVVFKILLARQISRRV